MDLSNSIIPDSTQWNAEDFLAGARTFVIAGVRAGTSEQPVNIELEGSDRTYRPSKSMRRVLVAAWGSNADAYVGRGLTLYRDPDVRFGKDVTGGIKISHLSDIGKRMTIALTVTRGKRAPHTVEPLPQTADTKAPKPESPLLAALNKVPDVSTDAERLEFCSLAAGRTIKAPTEITDADTAAVIEAAEQGATLDELRAASGAVVES